MKRIMKTVISIVMSFAMAVCLEPTLAGAEEISAQEISAQEYDISLASVNIGVPYSIKDKWGKITAQFSNQSTLLVTYTDLSSTSRYIKMYVSTSSKSFGVRKFVVKANKAHSESYGVNASGGKVTITVYRHTSSSPSSGQIDPIIGTLQ